jgi:hypothetical protein
VNIVNEPRWNASQESHTTELKDFGQAAENLCEKALNDARAQLHPLLRSAELHLLGERHEFVETFRLALERRIARKLATWQTRVLSIFRFDQTRRPPGCPWDGSIHLLAKVPRVSKTIQAWGQTLDNSLLPCLRALGWSCFQERQSVLEIQQVTPEEIRRGIGYGGMFFAAYTRPVSIWPQDRSHAGV